MIEQDCVSRKFSIDWDLFLESKNKTKRDIVDILDFKNFSQEFINTIRLTLDTEMKVVVAEAKKWSDIYWDFSILSRDNHNEIWHYGTRARLVGKSLSAEWYYNRFVKSPNGGKSSVFSTYLKKKGKDRYSLSVFKKAKKDELEAIKEVESHYIILRKKSISIMSIHKLLNEYEKLSQLDSTKVTKW